jgi:hypothetical protein
VLHGAGGIAPCIKKLQPLLITAVCEICEGMVFWSHTYGKLGCRFDWTLRTGMKKVSNSEDLYEANKLISSAKIKIRTA